MKKILLIVDIKSRDLPSLALIGYFLKKKYEIIYRRVDEIEYQTNVKFDCVILPKMNRFDDAFKFFFLETLKKKKKIICIENEGNISANIKKKFFILPDLYFLWGRTQQRKYKKVFTNKTAFKVLGNPRLDFFHHKFKELLIDKKEFLETNNLKDQFCLTFTTRTQEAHKDKKLISKIMNRRQFMYKESKNYFSDYVKSSKAMLKFTSNLLYKINKKFPNVNILIKPHPGENLKYWNYLEKKISNLKIVKGLTIENFLNLSDLNISHNLCSSTFEAKLLNIPTIELQTNFFKKYFSKIHQNIADDVTIESEKIISIINKEYKKKNKKRNQNKKIYNYVKSFFFKFDGERCRDYAKNIDIFLKKKKHNQYKLNKSQIDILSRLKKKFTEKKKSREEKKFNYKKLIKKFLVKLNLISNYDSRYRFDHRYEICDEIKWYKKFDKLLLKDI